MKTITFKVSDDEARLIRALAQREQISLSEYLRRQARGTSKNAALPKKERCEFTAAMIFAPLPGGKALTTSAVRDMLAEFP